MKKITFLLLILATIGIIISACKKETETDLFELLTTPLWTSDSLLVDGADASGPGQILEKFKGEIKFRSDGTGYFGQYVGTWRFADNQTQIMILTDSLPIPLVTKIAELSKQSLKLTTAYPSATIPGHDMQIRMTFKIK